MQVDNYGTQHGNSYAMAYGQTDNYPSTRDQSYTSNWNQATQGGTIQSHDFQHNGPNNTHFPSNYRPSLRDRQEQHGHPSPPLSGGPQPPRKRPYSTAFTKSPITGPKPQAAPAVPSFNASIPFSLPPKPTEPPPVKNKKPRKHNQLGLTPASQDHESSSNDENEEAKLSSMIANDADIVQFEYNGRIATLRTAAEIAAWIAERKKRYPTQAKAEAAKKEAAEKKQKWVDEKKRREEAAKAKRAEREQAQKEELRLKALELKKKIAEEKVRKKAGKARQDEVEEDEDHEIKAKKARIKADKLRLKAEKAELKVLEAEAAARKARDRRASLQSSASTQYELNFKDSSAKDVDSSIAMEGNDDEAMVENTIGTEGTNINKAERKGMKLPKSHDPQDAKAPIVEERDKGQISESSSSLSPSDSPALSDPEPTSSSASSPTSSDFGSESESAPEQTTSKRLHPTRVAPPPRRPPIHTQHLCRSLLATGHCKRGAECHYSHDLPDTLPSLDERKDKLKEKRKVRLGKAKAIDVPTAMTKERRKGLWQVMVEKEQEEERKQVLRAIIFMGENEMLGEDEKEVGGVDGAT
jgi:Nuclear fragile X mental retardation-interacting protein 1 (NUFIP1)/Zinc finger C-x8-C-x5-C-x3-H type (and similar)